MSDLHASDYIKNNNGGGGGISATQILTASGSVLAWSTSVEVDCTSNNITVTLPVTNIGTKNQIIVVKRMDNSNNTLKIIPYGSEQLESGTSPIYLFNQGESIMLQSKVGNSIIMSDNRGLINGTNNYLTATISSYQTTNTGSGDHIKFNTVLASCGNKITLDVASAYNASDGLASIGRFTVKPGTYDVDFDMAFIACASGAWGKMTLYDATNSKSLALSGWQSASGTGNNSCANMATTFTVTNDTLLEMRLIIDSGTVSSFGANTALELPRIRIRETKAQTNIIDTSDYFIGRMGSLSAFDASTSNYVDVPITKLDGNLAFSSPYITLNAGKKVVLTASLSLRCTWANYMWVDSTGAELPNSCRGVSASVSSTDNAPNTPAVAIFTPTTNMQVKLKVCGTGLYTNLMTSDMANSSIRITQLGKTGTTGVTSTLIDAPWTPFIPTITATTTNPVFGAATVYKCSYKIADKNTMKLNINIIGDMSAPTGNFGTGIYKIQIPSGYSMNTNLLQLATSSNWYDASTLAMTYMTNGGGAVPLLCKVLSYSATELVLYAISNGYWSNSVHAVRVSLSFMCDIPIV